MPKLQNYTEELKWLQAMANEISAPYEGKALDMSTDEDGTERVRIFPKDKAARYKGVNFFQGLWGYKEVALFLGLSPGTTKNAEFRRKLPALALWQAKGGKGKAGQQVLRWRPIEVMKWREEREAEVKRRLRNPRL